jgi:hypothetical protein
MSGRLAALWILGRAMLLALLRRVFGSPGGLLRFRAYYDPDRLPPVAPDERIEMPAYSRCIACGLCDRGESERIAASGGAYRGVMALVLAASRSMPEFRAAAYSASFVSEAVLKDKERVCPAHVPIAALSRFIRDKAAAVGGPLPLPSRLDSLPPRALAPRAG